MIQITINGQQREFNPPLTVSQLLEQLDLASERVVVELNKEILTVDKHNRSLQDSDTLELIQFVGGG